MAEKKSKKKGKLKEFIGPVAVTPNVRKQETIDGKNKSSNTGVGITLDTKFGTITLDKNNNISSFDGGKDYETDTKKITFGKDFDTKFGKISVSGNIGKTKHPGGKSKTKGGSVSITKTFRSGGLVKKGKPKLNCPSIVKREKNEMQKAIIVNSTPGGAFNFSLL